MKDEKAAHQFKVAFRNKDKSLAPHSKPETVAVQTTGLRTVESLKPKSHCLSCPEICLDSERQAHTTETDHAFCKLMTTSKGAALLTRTIDIESRTRFLHCQKCGDFIYDHGLERLRGPLGKSQIGGKYQITRCSSREHSLNLRRGSIYLGRGLGLRSVREEQRV